MALYLMIAAVTAAAAAGVNAVSGFPEGTRGRALGRSCLFLIFLVLAVPAVLRQETGNDYLRYVEFFHLASIDAYVPTEPGFNALVKFLYHLCGYENYLLVFAVFSLLTTLFFLIAIRQQAENFAFSFFLFMMFGYYFQSWNTMRYYLALSMTLVAMTCFIRRQYAGFLALTVLAALFHKSALIVLVLYPLAVHIWKKWEYVLAVLLGGCVLAFHGKVLELLVDLYPTWEDTGDLAAGTSVSWANIAKCLAVLVLTAIVIYVSNGKKEEATHTAAAGGGVGGAELRSLLHERSAAGRQMRMYVNGSFLGLLIYVFGWFVPEVSRICYYLIFSQIFLIPMLISRIPPERERLRKMMYTAVMAAAVVYFIFFLRHAYGDTTKLLPYKTFLFHELNRTPSGSIE